MYFTFAKNATSSPGNGLNLVAALRGVNVTLSKIRQISANIGSNYILSLFLVSSNVKDIELRRSD